ncbi:hypothetical protein ACVFYP_22200 [Roseomonas sp. F4]
MTGDKHAAPSRSEIEGKARELCLAAGHDPDSEAPLRSTEPGGPIAMVAVPRWSLFRDQAREALGIAPFQARATAAVVACLGEALAGNTRERRLRFLEEALEAAQSPDPDGTPGLSAGEMMQMVEYVASKQADPIKLEIGQVMLALAALASATGVDMAAAGEDDLRHVLANSESIALRHAAKPRIVAP